jgi:hypothetical protein
METQKDLDKMKEADKYQKMIKILPNEAGAFDLEDLEAFYNQNG